jgi:hypothetical protein
MGKFKDLTPEAMEAVGERIIRNAQRRIMQQVPRPGNRPVNPYATGNLARSVRFNWEKTEQDIWSLEITYATHGVYTAFGTRSYNDSAAREAGFFGRDFRGYERGRGGIRPQYWLSLRGDQPVYEAIIEAELKMTYETFLNNTISGLKRGTTI